MIAKDALSEYVDLFLAYCGPGNALSESTQLKFFVLQFTVDDFTYFHAEVDKGNEQLKWMDPHQHEIEFNSAILKELNNKLNESLEDSSQQILLACMVFYGTGLGYFRQVEEARWITEMTFLEHLKQYGKPRGIVLERNHLINRSVN